MNFTKLLNKAKTEKNQIPQLLGTLILFNSENLVEGIRKRWLFGKDPNGGIIGNYSNSPMGRDYQSFKVSFNPNAGGTVDLTLTGALGKGLTFRKRSNTEYEILSTDWKFDKIADKYGLEQFNLDEQQRKELFDMLTFYAYEEYFRNVWL
jgi:hypothetical protein